MQQTQQPKTFDVVVDRPFMFKGQRQGIGVELKAVDRALAIELVNNQKAHYAGATPVSTGPLTTDISPLVSGPRRAAREPA